MMDRDWLVEMFGVEGQVAVVTGGSGVLGRAMSLGLARAGARLVILSRRLEACQKVVDEIRAAGGEALAIAADVMEAEALEKAAVQVEADFGPVEILVNAAGGARPGGATSPGVSFFGLDLDVVDEIINLNMMGSFLACRAFGRAMAERGHGVIINIGSMTDKRPLTRVVAYGAAKAAVTNFTHWLAVHMAMEHSPNIRVNAIAPGFLLTEQNHHLLVDDETGGLTDRAQRMLAHTPMGRLGEPDDLVGALLWLVSPAAAYVTGIVIPVEGGFLSYSGI
jgi:NAD(P)-dependent dehydrogenase (short-subunit alcohol dehydrogenase family)